VKGERWKDFKLTAAFHFPPPAFLQSEAVGSSEYSVSYKLAKQIGMCASAF